MAFAGTFLAVVSMVSSTCTIGGITTLHAKPARRGSQPAVRVEDCACLPMTGAWKVPGGCLWPCRMQHGLGCCEHYLTLDVLPRALSAM